ncbi:hypothetical protein ACVWWP_008493 [Bradyrhizobium sp. LM3.6]
MQAKPAEPLTLDPDSALPVPTQHSSTGVSSTKFPGSDQSFRSELEASIPAALGDVLAFYRTELTKRGWQEKADGATVTAERAELAFTSPEGPAVLKLGRARDETIVSLVQRNPQAAAKADIMPKAGQARLMLGNMGPKEASLTINNQTVKIAAGAGGPQSPKGPDARSAARQVPVRAASGGTPCPDRDPHRGRRRCLGPPGGAKRRRAAASDVLSLQGRSGAFQAPRNAPRPRKIHVFHGPKLLLESRFFQRLESAFESLENRPKNPI